MGGPPPLPLTEGQTYCLRWNNHKSNLVEILDALIKVESYVDCTIVVDDQVQFKAHRVVLAANSPYFQTILQDVPMDHCSIIFPGVKAFEMRALLEYMYTGEVNVTQSQIPKIMRIAEELEVKGLFDMADLKEKFNKLGEEHAERNPYASSSGGIPNASIYAAASAAMPSSSSVAQNGGKDSSDAQHQQPHQPQNSSSVISTSTNISPSAAPSSSCSPPYGSYKSPYANLYSKSPGPGLAASSSAQSSAIAASAAAAAAAAVVAASTAQTSTHHTQSSSTSQQSSAERGAAGQWPLSPSAAAAMLSSVYESAPDMNPLKRKKLSSISSMLMNRDTPILRNVLAQTNPADSSQPMPLLLPGSAAAAKSEKHAADKNSTHVAALVAGAHNNNHTFNGSDYSSDKKYHDEPHSPYTDRSFEDDSFDQKGNYSGSGFGSNSSANQKPEWKRYKQYTRNDIMSAIQCVRDGMSALQASRKFGVPSRTLYDKVKKLGITTGRPMNRTMKRSPSSVESSAAFPYAHGYGQPETSALLSSMHERERERDERGEPKEHHRAEHHHMPPTIPHPAAALLDHAFLQQALENRGGDIAGREALHAMALAAAAHAAANRLSSSPGPNGNVGRRTPSPPPSFSMKYAPRPSEHEMLLEHEKERRLLDSEMAEREQDIEMERQREHELSRERVRERVHLERERERAHEHEEGERDADDEEDDHVEDLSVARKDSFSPESRRADSPYSPPPAAAALPVSAENGSGVIVPPMHASSKLPTTPTATATAAASPAGAAATAANSSGSSDELMDESTLKREIVSDDGRAD